jgi:hypothetical protein
VQQQRRKTFVVMVNNQPRWEIKAFSASEAIELAKSERNYPEGYGKGPTPRKKGGAYFRYWGRVRLYLLTTSLRG